MCARRFIAVAGPTVSIVSIFLISFSSAFSQQSAPDPNYELLHGSNFIVSKNYYLITLFNELKDVQALLANDRLLSAAAKTKRDSLNRTFAGCGKDGGCYINAMKFSAEEIATISARLADLYSQGNPLDKLVQNHLIPSGTYALYQHLPAKKLLVKAWEQDANAINGVLEIYAAGKKPNYPLIDSISFATKDTSNNNIYRLSYVNLLYNTASLVALENQSNTLFYSLPLTAALQFLEMNEREQAADYEPMEQGENKAAVDRVKKIKWNDYKYSVILIPGAGPDGPDVALSAEGMLRCRLAALQYQKGLAPFIVPSGGKVHPYKTKYCEAIEMKQYLIKKLHIPADAIIIEPHARHTTTNLRNTVRLIYRYGLPFTKPGLVCTTRYQSKMIGSTLIERCQKELNEVPYQYGKRLSETEIEFYPVTAALQLDPDEPMDP